MELTEKIKLEITPYFILVAILIYTIFIYTLGSLYYDCLCREVNILETLERNDYSTCNNYFENKRNQTFFNDPDYNPILETNGAINFQKWIKNTSD